MAKDLEFEPAPSPQIILAEILDAVLTIGASAEPLSEQLPDLMLELFSVALAAGDEVQEPVVGHGAASKVDRQSGKDESHDLGLRRGPEVELGSLGEGAVEVVSPLLVCMRREMGMVKSGGERWGERVKEMERTWLRGNAMRIARLERGSLRGFRARTCTHEDPTCSICPIPRSHSPAWAWVGRDLDKARWKEAPCWSWKWY